MIVVDRETHIILSQEVFFIDTLRNATALPVPPSQMGVCYRFNQDNHLRNHGFLLSKNQWTFSPSYDMNPINNADFLSLYIDLDDGYRSFDKALKTVSFYHLTREQGVNIIKEIVSTVAESWRPLAIKNGISESEKNFMGSAFELAERETVNKSILLSV